ncbi:hypothetical protein VNO78_20747 [Psophocarpus tetragonolobus]|uniref:Uncharacterized protein n=1 Tax=Psophocarpus tetragonolobus TaxID=3891 RepID=A0AAN9SDX9_PSOTE
MGVRVRGRNRVALLDCAQKRPHLVDGFVNSIKKLHRPNISSNHDRTFSMSDIQESFRNIRLQTSFSFSFKQL